MSANFNDPAANAPDAATYKGKGKAEDPSVEMSMDEEDSEDSENENEELVSSEFLRSKCQKTHYGILTLFQVPEGKYRPSFDYIRFSLINFFCAISTISYETYNTIFLW